MDVDTLVQRWAKGDYGTEAAAYIHLNSILRDKMTPESGWLALYDEDGGTVKGAAFAHADRARPRWDEWLSANGGASTSERFLAQLCENIAHGPEDAPGIDLSANLWRLDDRHRRAVLAGLAMGLLGHDPARRDLAVSALMTR